MAAARGKAGRRCELGKFNAGQKLNAIFVAGVLPVMLLTGSIMYWNRPFSDSWRTGATFVHDWGFVTLLIVVVGHIAKALVEPTLLSSIFRGWVPSAVGRAPSAAVARRGRRHGGHRRAGATTWPTPRPVEVGDRAIPLR